MENDTQERERRAMIGYRLSSGITGLLSRVPRQLKQVKYNAMRWQFLGTKQIRLSKLNNATMAVACCCCLSVGWLVLMLLVVL